jgi:hypothetical protein
MGHTRGERAMTYAMKPLTCDPAHIKGMSERLIVSHYENNYGGAVKRLNLIDEKLAELTPITSISAPRPRLTSIRSWMPCTGRMSIGCSQK